MTLQRWGGLASFLLAVTLIVPELIYLMGNLHEPDGPFSYALADFLYGPVKAASLITAVYALQERIGKRASRLTGLALLAAALSAAMFVTAAFFRATNRHYHLIHPELHLESAVTVLIVWTTLVTGVIATAWHFLGWSLLLLGSAGWASGRLPRGLIGLYWVVGAAALFVYLLGQNLEGFVVLLGVVMSIWQGIALWRAGAGEVQAPEINAGQPDIA